jgi:hypothetical protein
MKPHDPLQPTGSLNMSQLDGKLLLKLKKTGVDTFQEITNVEEETVNDAKHLNYLHIYGLHWNELNIQKGMAGLRWSN